MRELNIIVNELKTSLYLDKNVIEQSLDKEMQHK